MALSGVGEVYIISAAVGSIFLAFSAAMGQMGGGDHGGGHIGHDAGQGHAAIGSHSTGHSHSGGHSPDLGDADPSNTLPAITAKPGFIPSVARGSLAAALTVLSPMTLSIFFAFFGFAGMMALRLAPWLGLWSLLPAVIAGAIITRLLLRLFALLVRSADVSSAARSEDVIGQMAHVTVSIREGRTGEITCEMGSKRYNYPARGLDPTKSFATGSRAIISDLREGIVYLEPWTDIMLESDGPS